MKKTIIVILALLLSGNLSAGIVRDKDPVLDSLNEIINDSLTHDTSLAKAKLRLSYVYYERGFDSIIPLYKKTVLVAETALKKQPDSLSKYSLLKTLSVALVKLGQIFDDQGETSYALDYFEKALAAYSKQGNEKGRAIIYGNMGAILSNTGKIEEGLEQYFNSLIIHEALNNHAGMALSYNRIGLIYRNHGELDKALELFQKCLKLNVNLGRAIAYNNIGLIFRETGEYEKSLQSYRQSLKIQKSIDDIIGMGYSNTNMGSVYMDLEQPDTALLHYLSGLNYYKKRSYKKGIVNVSTLIGSVYLEQGDLQGVLEYCKPILPMAQQLGYPKYISRTAELLSRTYRKQNNWEEALGMYELHIQMRDSINNEKTQNAAIRQQTKYEFEKEQLVKEQEEKERERLEAEVTSRRDNLQYSVILIALLVLFGGVLFLRFVKVSTKMAEGIIFFSFLILFEFFLVLADPYIEIWSGGAPGFKLLFNACIAALIFPAHSFFEERLKGRLKKN